MTLSHIRAAKASLYEPTPQSSQVSPDTSGSAARLEHGRSEAADLELGNFELTSPVVTTNALSKTDYPLPLIRVSKQSGHEDIFNTNQHRAENTTLLESPTSVDKQSSVGMGKYYTDALTEMQADTYTCEVIDMTKQDKGSKNVIDLTQLADSAADSANLESAGSDESNAQDDEEESDEEPSENGDESKDSEQDEDEEAAGSDHDDDESDNGESAHDDSDDDTPEESDKDEDENEEEEQAEDADLPPPSFDVCEIHAEYTHKKYTGLKVSRVSWTGYGRGFDSHVASATLDKGPGTLHQDFLDLRSKQRNKHPCLSPDVIKKKFLGGRKLTKADQEFLVTDEGITLKARERKACWVYTNGQILDGDYLKGQIIAVRDFAGEGLARGNEFRDLKIKLNSTPRGYWAKPSNYHEPLWQKGWHCSYDVTLEKPAKLKGSMKKVSSKETAKRSKRRNLDDSDLFQPPSPGLSMEEVVSEDDNEPEDMEVPEDAALVTYPKRLVVKGVPKTKDVNVLLEWLHDQPLARAKQAKEARVTRDSSPVEPTNKGKKDAFALMTASARKRAEPKQHKSEEAKIAENDDGVKAQEKRIKQQQKQLEKLAIDTCFSIMELCAGGGGAESGFKMAGLTPILAVDLMADMACSLTANNTGAVNLMENLMNIKVKKDADGTLVLLMAGLPCQTFSLLGKGEGFANEEKGYPLWEHFLMLATELQPHLLVVENVGAAAMKFSMNTHMRKLFAKSGYDIEMMVINASNCGVPQTRRRVFIVCTRKDLPIKWNFAKYLQLTKSTATLGDCVDSPTNPIPFADQAKVSARKHEEVVAKFIKEGGRIGDVDPTLIKNILSHIANVDHIKKQRDGDLRKPKFDKPCPTVVTNTAAGFSALFHARQNRGFTDTELGRVQSFPDDHWFAGPRDTRHTQIGNAIPCLLAKRIGLAFKEWFFDNVLESHKQKLDIKIPPAVVNPFEWTRNHLEFTDESSLKCKSTRTCRTTAPIDLSRWNPKKPDTSMLHEGDRIVMEWKEDMDDSKEHVAEAKHVDNDEDLELTKIKGVVYENPTKNDDIKYARFIDPQTGNFTLVEIKANLKNNTEGLVGVVPVVETMDSLRAFDVNRDPNRGTLIATCRLDAVSEKSWTTRIPYEKIADMTQDDVDFPFDTISSTFDLVNNHKKFLYFRPYIVGYNVIGYPYKLGTRVEVQGTRENYRNDRHWPQGRVVENAEETIEAPDSKGKKHKFKDRYLVIEFPKGTSKVHPECDTHENGHLRLKLRFQTNGRVYLPIKRKNEMFNQEMPIRPIMDPPKRGEVLPEDWDILGSATRDKEFGNVKLLCGWGPIGGGQAACWMSRSQADPFAPTNSHYVTSVPVLMKSLVNSKKIVDSTKCRPELTVVNFKQLSHDLGSTLEVSTKQGNWVKAGIVQNHRRDLELVMPDGHSEHVDREKIICRIPRKAGPAPKKGKIKKVKWSCPRQNIKESTWECVDVRGQKGAGKTRANVKPLATITPTDERAARLGLYPMPVISQGHLENKTSIENVKKMKAHRVRINMKNFVREIPVYAKYHKDHPAPVQFGNFHNWPRGKKFLHKRQEIWQSGCHFSTQKGISIKRVPLDTLKLVNRKFTREYLEEKDVPIEKGDLVILSNSLVFGQGYSEDTDCHDSEVKLHDELLYTGEGREGALKGSPQEKDSPGNKGIINCNKLGLAINVFCLLKAKSPGQLKKNVNAAELKKWEKAKRLADRKGWYVWSGAYTAGDEFFATSKEGYKVLKWKMTYSKSTMSSPWSKVEVWCLPFWLKIHEQRFKLLKAQKPGPNEGHLIRLLEHVSEFRDGTVLKAWGRKNPDLFKRANSLLRKVFALRPILPTPELPSDDCARAKNWPVISKKKLTADGRKWVQDQAKKVAKAKAEAEAAKSPVKRSKEATAPTRKRKRTMKATVKPGGGVKRRKTNAKPRMSPAKTRAKRRRPTDSDSLLSSSEDEDEEMPTQKRRKVHRSKNRPTVDLVSASESDSPPSRRLRAHKAPGPSNESADERTSPSAEPSEGEEVDTATICVA